MAIQDNRLRPDSIASLVRVDFNTKEEIVENTGTTSSTEPDSSTILDKKPNVNSSPVDEAQGIHKASANNKYGPRANMSKGIKTKLANTSNAREFKVSEIDLRGGPYADGVSVSTPAIDKFLETNTGIDTNHDILSSSVNDKLDGLIRVELGDINLSRYGLNNLDISNSVKSKLVSSISGFSGTSILNKLSLDSLLNDCFRSGFNYNIGDFSFLANLVNSSLLDSISCGSIETAIGFVTDQMGDTPEGRYNMMGNIKSSLNKNNDGDVGNKLLLTKIIMDKAESDDERNLLSIQSRGITKTVLTNLDDSDYGTNSTNSDYINITEGLDALDPNWKKDELGEVNYFKVSNNGKMNDLATSRVANKHDIPETLGGPVETKIDDSLGIVINSSVKRSSHFTNEYETYNA